MLGLVHVILTVLNKITDYDHDKYHMYDAVPAYIMLGFRCITLIIFLVGLIITIVTIDKDHTITNYFVQLACIGGNYIIMIPLLMYIVNHIQPG